MYIAASGFRLDLIVIDGAWVVNGLANGSWATVRDGFEMMEFCMCMGWVYAFGFLVLCVVSDAFRDHP